MTGLDEPKGLTPEEKERVDILIGEVDDVTKEMAEEWYLTRLSHDWTSYLSLKERHNDINNELSELFKKRGDTL